MTVYVFGSINVDHVAYVDQNPRIGETVFGRYMQFPGGKGANQAIAAARAGAQVAMIGAVGQDPAGDFMLDTIREEGISSGLIEISDTATGVALITVDSNSHNSIVVCPGSNENATTHALSQDSLDANSIVLSQGEVSRSEVESLFERSKRAGAITIYNSAPHGAISQTFQDTIDYLILNEIEFSQHYKLDRIPEGFDDVELAMRSQDLKLNLIVTLGSLGAVAIIDGETIPIIAPKVNAIDTVGAGDCFCGNFAARLSLGDPIRSALLYAVHAASLSVTRHGASSSMPRRSEMTVD